MHKIRYVSIILLVFLIVLIGTVPYLGLGQVHVEWSPEGNWVVFSCTQFTRTKNKSNLYIMAIDGGSPQQITADHFVAQSPTWSADGDWIAFYDRNTVYRIKPDGTDITEILTISPLKVITSLDWAVKDDWIAFATKDIQGSDIWIIRPDGTDQRRIAQTQYTYDRLSWSVNEDILGFAILPTSPLSGVYYINIHSTEITEILPYNQIIGQIDWSPIDRELMLDLTTEKFLYRLHIDSGEVAPIRVEDFWSGASWSPDGEWFIYIGLDSANGGNQLALYQARLDGTQSKQLAQFSDCVPSSPKWFDYSTVD